MDILHEDAALIAAIKPRGIVSQCTDQGNGFADLLADRNGGYIGVVHRLDRGVDGVMIYAKTPRSAARLSAFVQNGSVKKEYLAVVHGVPSPTNGTMRDLLFHDRARNKTFVVERVRQGVKEAILDYEILETLDTEEYGTISLVHITLGTGRTHQIRVQFASRGHALVGDGKYGARDRCEIGLCCHRITLPHPESGQELSFSYISDGAPWGPFSALLGKMGGTD